MRVALLSAGPSLVRTFDESVAHGLRIGVNSAVAKVACDWWSCGDGQTFERIRPIGLPAIYTIDAADSRFRSTPELARQFTRHRVEVWNRFGIDKGNPRGWTNWSITAGLALAVHLGARQVDVFGHDMAGVTDCSGHNLLTRREKWRRVRADWMRLVHWAQGRGIKIVEHQESMACTP